MLILSTTLQALPCHSSIVPIEAVRREEIPLTREVYWQANLGTLVDGLNCRKDFNIALRQRVTY